MLTKITKYLIADFALNVILERIENNFKIHKIRKNLNYDDFLDGCLKLKWQSLENLRNFF